MSTNSSSTDFSVRHDILRIYLIGLVVRTDLTDLIDKLLPREVDCKSHQLVLLPCRESRWHWRCFCCVRHFRQVKISYSENWLKIRRRRRRERIMIRHVCRGQELRWNWGKLENCSQPLSLNDYTGISRPRHSSLNFRDSWASDLLLVRSKREVFLLLLFLLCSSSSSFSWFSLSSAAEAKK